MNIRKLTDTIAFIDTTQIIIYTPADATDCLANVRYQTDCDCLILPIDAFSAEFFDLKTKIAGEILQKFVTYDMRLAIVGDFTPYTNNSKSLRDFIFESNKGKAIGFVADQQAAIDFLSK